MSIQSNAFCIGFAYGEQYGYKGTRDKLSDEAISSTWILALMLYNKLYGEQDDKKGEPNANNNNKT